MPYIQPKTNNYFGLMPVTSPGTLIPSNLYLVSSSEANAIAPGDVVCQTSKGTVRQITGAYIPTSSMATVGVAASFVPANGGSTAALLNNNTSQMVMVYDAPQQTYVIADTTSASAGAQDALYKNYAILATGAIGSTGAFQVGLQNSRSNMALSGATSTAQGAFHLIALHPVEQGQFSSGGAGVAVTSSGVSKWIGMLVGGVSIQVVSSAQLLSVQNTTS